MIKVTVELWPFGKEEGKKVLGEAVIFNDGTGDMNLGNYGVRVRKANNVWKAARFTGFKRKRYGAWELLFLALVIVYGKNIMAAAKGVKIEPRNS